MKLKSLSAFFLPCLLLSCAQMSPTVKRDLVKKGDLEQRGHNPLVKSISPAEEPASAADLKTVLKWDAQNQSFLGTKAPSCSKSSTAKVTDSTGNITTTRNQLIKDAQGRIVESQTFRVNDQGSIVQPPFLTEKFAYFKDSHLVTQREVYSENIKSQEETFTFDDEGLLISRTKVDLKNKGFTKEFKFTYDINKSDKTVKEEVFNENGDKLSSAIFNLIDKTKVEEVNGQLKTTEFSVMRLTLSKNSPIFVLPKDCLFDGDSVQSFTCTTKTSVLDTQSTGLLIGYDNGFPHLEWIYSNLTSKSLQHKNDSLSLPSRETSTKVQYNKLSLPIAFTKTVKVDEAETFSSTTSYRYHSNNVCVEELVETTPQGLNYRETRVFE